MKKILLALALFISIFYSAKGQKVDSIFFHLYTDSLKKGTHNYINVDGKLSDGKWMPLTEKEIIYTATYGEFEKNNLVLPPQCTVDKLTIKAVLKTQPSIWKEITIWIKKKPDDEILPAKEEILNKPPFKKTKEKGKN